jgi:predicted enzyme related to lactoylglutathione lyase
VRKRSTAIEAQEVPMNPVVHFEVPAKDRMRKADFYTQVFGWRTQMLGPEMGNYVVVTTTELDTNGRPKSPGTINGGFFQKSNDKPDQYPSIAGISAVQKGQLSWKISRASSSLQQQ